MAADNTFEVIKTMIDDIKTDFRDLRSQVSEIKVDLTEVRTEIRNLQADFRKHLKDEVETLTQVRDARAVVVFSRRVIWPAVVALFGLAVWAFTKGFIVLAL